MTAKRFARTKDFRALCAEAGVSPTPRAFRKLMRGGKGNLNRFLAGKAVRKTAKHIIKNPETGFVGPA